MRRESAQMGAPPHIVECCVTASPVEAGGTFQHKLGFQGLWGPQFQVWWDYVETT